MQDIKITIKTYRCQSCGWHSDYEPTAENHAKFFTVPGYIYIPTNNPFKNVSDGICPACHLGIVCKCENNDTHIGQVLLETDPTKCMTVSIMHPDKPDALIWHGDVMKLPKIADEHDKASRETIKPIRKPLSDNEKEILKNAIQQSLEFNKSREHKG